MGYSIAVPLKSAKARDECLAFLKANFRPWTKVKPSFPEGVQMLANDVRPDYDWTQGVCSDKKGEETLDYDSGTNRVGFNCSTSDGFIGEYAKAVLRFCALRWGRRRMLKKYTGTRDFVPYWVYDGYEAMPVLVESEWRDRAPQESWWAFCDGTGFKPFRRPWQGPWNPAHAPRAVQAGKGAVVPEPVQKVLFALGAKLEDVDQWIDGRVESDDPLVVEKVIDAFEEADVPHTVEYGPMVLSGFRKRIADEEEVTYITAEKVVREELQRLEVQVAVTPT